MTQQPDNSSQSRALTNQQVVRAALVVIAGFLASGVLGFVRTGVLSAQFGASGALDAFYAAQQIPEVIFVIVAGGALGSSFIPVYAQTRDDSQADGWRLASAVMTLAFLAALLFSALIVLLAPWLITTILRPNDPPELQQLIINLTRLMMLTPCIFAVSGLVMGILQSHGLFFLPSLAISMNSIGIMIGALVIAPLLPAADGLAQIGDANVYGLAYGAILSAVLHLLVQLPGLWRLRAPLRFLPNLHLPGVREVLRLMGPRVLGQGVVQVNFLVNIFFTGFMVNGSYTALRTAFMLMFFALGVIGQSVGSAVFPTLSALYAEGDMDGYKDRLAAAMRSVLFLSFPATVAFILLGEPIVSVFERGEWTTTDTQATAWALAFYATGIAGFALLEILSRAFYALSDTWTPVRFGILAMVSNIVFSALLIQVIGEADNLARGRFAGLALANAVTTLVEAGLLWWVLRRRIGSIRDRHVLDGAGRALLAALLMGVVLWGLPQILPFQGILLALAGGVIGGAVFFGAGLLLGLDEAKAVPLMLLRRFRR
jgi:putative peptidoglycan lipid II flippase